MSVAGKYFDYFICSCWFQLVSNQRRGTTAVSWRVAKQVGQEENVRGVAPAVREESGKTSRGPGQGITSITGWKEEGHN